MDKHTQQRPRARTSKPARHYGPPPIPQYPPYRAVLLPVPPHLQAAHDRLSEAHGRACLALALDELEREAAEEAQAVSARQQGEEAATRQQEAADEERPAAR